MTNDYLNSDVTAGPAHGDVRGHVNVQAAQLLLHHLDTGTSHNWRSCRPSTMANVATGYEKTDSWSGTKILPSKRYSTFFSHIVTVKF